MLATTTEVMKAVVQDTYGDASVLQIAERSIPTPKDDQVLIKVEAAGLDRGTWHLMHGIPYIIRPAFGFTRPRQPVPGRDVAGRVAAVGSAVTEFAVGDAVFGIAPGSFAEFAVTEADKLLYLPEGLPFVEAAALGISGLTALGAVVDKAQVKAGQRVLITGAAGGVGSYAVQIAAGTGAHVTGVCSGSKSEYVSGLGADHTVDYTRDPITATNAPYDVIIEIAGMTPVKELRKVLTPTGTIVFVGGEGTNKLTSGFGRTMWAAAKSPFIKQNLTMMLASESATDLARLLELVVDGVVRVPIDSVYPLDEASAAMHRLESGAPCGKIGIAIEGSA